MKNEINENDIKKLTFADAPFNMSHKWQHELEYNLPDKEPKVVITFMTTTGTYSVHTSIRSVTGIYLRTCNDVVIPLSSITHVYFKTNGIEDKEPPLGYYLMLLIITVILLFIIFLIPFINTYR